MDAVSSVIVHTAKTLAAGRVLAALDPVAGQGIKDCILLIVLGNFLGNNFL